MLNKLLSLYNNNQREVIVDVNPNSVHLLILNKQIILLLLSTIVPMIKVIPTVLLIIFFPSPECFPCLMLN